MEKRLVGGHGGNPVVGGHEDGLAQLVVPRAIVVGAALECVELDVLIQKVFPDRC